MEFSISFFDGIVLSWVVCRYFGKIGCLNFYDMLWSIRKLKKLTTEFRISLRFNKYICTCKKTNSSMVNIHFEPSLQGLFCDML
jgi:hypothetical protein